jgi:hypothetical protein
MQSDDFADTLPCRHGLPQAEVDAVKVLLTTLDQTSPQLLRDNQIDPGRYQRLLRAAIESLRGTASATTSDKRRFLETILDFGVEQSKFDSWSFVGTENRQDYRVTLPDGTAVSIEAKGCPDGNNLTIWDRPGWANEFIVWSMCPESLAHEPGEGLWSGIATRLIPKLAAERTIVDALVFWDARCGSELRRCPKLFGVGGDLRRKATSIPGQDGQGWLPPPCVYLLPQAPPVVRNNPRPRTHTLETCKFANVILDLFNVPSAERHLYAHSAYVESRGTPHGTQIRVTTVSRMWPDGEERAVSGRWKAVRRE